MKALTATLLIGTLLAGVAQAAEPSTITEEKCRGLHDYAGKVMKARQLDMEAPQLMGLTRGNKLKEILVRLAYREPSYATDEYKQRAIREFANAAYLDCLDRM